MLSQVRISYLTHDYHDHGPMYLMATSIFVVCSQAELRRTEFVPLFDNDKSC